VTHDFWRFGAEAPHRRLDSLADALLPRAGVAAEVCDREREKERKKERERQSIWIYTLLFKWWQSLVLVFLFSRVNRSLLHILMSFWCHIYRALFCNKRNFKEQIEVGNLKCTSKIKPSAVAHSVALCNNAQHWATLCNTLRHNLQQHFFVRTIKDGLCHSGWIRCRVSQKFTKEYRSAKGARADEWPDRSRQNSETGRFDQNTVLSL